MFALPFAARAAVMVALAACFVLIGMGTHKVFADRKIARMERDWNAERAAAAAATAAAEANARRIETAWRDHVAQREKDYAANLARQADRIRALDAAGSGLRQRLAAYTGAGSPAPGAADACGAERRRTETLGLLVAEADGLADESSREADRLRDLVGLCRGWAEALTARQP
ncbi:MAG TPA: hypothetical protein PLW68_15920 [Casimicrobiaceae bacterium]|nr:hypothetical protein [Casimicrobiaceae bacterium]